MGVEILFLDLTGFKNLLGLKKDCNGQRDQAIKKFANAGASTDYFM